MVTTVTSEWSDPVAFSVKTVGTSFAEQGKLPVTGLASGDQFGRLVAISGDGTIALIGATYDGTLNASGNGAVYYYKRSGATWTQVSKITLSEAATTTNFGSGVALNYDGTKALITITGKSDTYTNEGIVIEFSRSGDVWTRGSSIVAPDPMPNKNFGAGVALSGDGLIAAIGANQDKHYGPNSGSVYIFKRISGVWTYHQKLYAFYGTTTTNYEGSGVALSGDGAYLAVNSSQSVTLFTQIDGFYVEQTIIGDPDKALKNAPYGFGWGVSFSGDGSLLAVGDYTDKTALSSGYSGSVYIYRRQGSVWSLIQKFYASDVVAGDYFGHSVSLTADGTSLLVGNFTRSSSTGVVYDFELTATGWSEQVCFYSVTGGLVTPSVANERFGGGVAVSSDGSIAVVSAQGDNNEAGLVLVYRRTGDTWTYEASVTGTSGDGNSRISVAISGDGTIVFIGTQSRGSNRGTVLVYDYKESGLSTSAKYTLNGVGNNYFGSSLATNDTGSLLVIGEKGTTGSVGIVRVYAGSITSGWTQQQIVSDPDMVASGKFGGIVTLSRDGTKAVIASNNWLYSFTISGSVWTLSNRTTLAVASIDASSLALSSDGLTLYVGDGPLGTVKVYTRASVSVDWGFSYQLVTKNKHLVTTGSFGNALAIASDNSVLLVGAQSDVGAGVSLMTGSVAAFVDPTKFLSSAVGSLWTERNRFVDPFVQLSSQFGTTLALSDDGLTAVVGAPSHANVSTQQGAAYVYVRSGTKWSLVTELLPENVYLTANGKYGASCAISGDGNTIAIGATMASNSGAVYVFVKTGAVWKYQATFTAPSAATYDYFGCSCALSATGDVLVVGAYAKDGTYGDQGAAYVYTRSGGLWTQTYALSSPAGNAVASGYFGSSVAISSTGAVVVVGAEGENTYGRAYVYVSGTLKATLNPIESATLFGNCVEVSADGKTVLVSHPNGGYLRGAVHYYRSEDLVTWTAMQSIGGAGTGAPLLANGETSISIYNNGAGFIVASDVGLINFEKVGTEYVAKNRAVGMDNLIPSSQTVAVSADGSVILYGHANGPSFSILCGSVTALYKGDIAYSTTEKRTLVHRRKLFPTISSGYRFGSGVAVDVTDTYMLVGRITSTGNQIVYYKKVNGYWQYVNEFSVTGAVAASGIGTTIAMTSDGLTALIGEPDYTGGGCFYRFTRSGDTWTQQERVTPSPAIGSQQFGASIAVYGAGNALTAFVGAPLNSTKTSQAGALYVFTWNGSVWTQQTIFYAPSPAGSYQFGQAVAVSGGGTWLVIGEPGAAGNGTSGAGQVHLYKLSGGSYSYQNTFRAANAYDLTYAAGFGNTLAMNYDGNVVVVGVNQGASKNGLRYAITYTYTRSGSSLTLRGTLGADDTWNASSFQSGGGFRATAISGYLSVANGSSIKVYTGANADMERNGGIEAGSNPGALYALDTTLAVSDVAVGSSLVQVDKIVDPVSLTASEAFGYAVSITPDGSRAVVTADTKTVTYSSQGSGYVYVKSTERWLYESTLLASDPTGSDLFGTGVSISSDGATVLIGAGYKTGAAGAQQGAAYVFTRSGGVWTQQAKLLASDPTAGNYFGYSVGLSSDGNTALIGAYYKNGTYNAQGAAYVFTRSGTTWTQQAKLLAGDPIGSDYFGRSVILSSDGTTALIGAPNKSDSYIAQGAAYVFTRSGGAWTQQAKLLASDPYTGDQFGNSVILSSDGNTALIGAYSKNNGQGAAYVFTRSGGAWTQQAKLLPSDSMVSDYFGTSVGLSSDGNSALIGAYYKTGAAGSGQGSAYVFTRGGGMWTQQTKLVAGDPATGDNFGYAVSLSGDGSIGIVGAHQKDVNALSHVGAVYTFANLTAHPEYL